MAEWSQQGGAAVIIRTVILLTLLIALAAQPVTAQAAVPVTCTVTQTVTHSDGRKTSSVRFAEHCVLLPLVVGGADQ